MADVKNIARSDAVQLINHDERNHEKYANEDIQSEYTKDNYNLAPKRDENSVDYFHKRLENLTVSNQKKTTVLQSVIVTQPKDMPFEDGDRFFQAVYDFYKQFYGEENIICADVHKDEYIRGEDGYHPKDEKSGMPHISIKAIPETDGRVNARNKTPKGLLKQMHRDLQKYVSEQLGYEVHTLNDKSGPGREAIADWKAERAEAKAEQAEAMAEQKQQDLQDLNITYDSRQAESDALELHVDGLKKAVKAMNEDAPKLSNMLQPKKNLSGDVKYYTVSVDDAERLRKTIQMDRAELKRLKSEVPSIEKVGSLTKQVAELEAESAVKDEAYEELAGKYNDLVGRYNDVVKERAFFQLPFVRARAENTADGLTEEMREIEAEVKNVGMYSKVENDINAGYKASEGLVLLTRAETPDTKANALGRLKSCRETCETLLNRFRGAVNRICKVLPIDIANQLGDLHRDRIRDDMSYLKAYIGLEDDRKEIMPVRTPQKQKGRKTPNKSKMSL